jgi:hypothetical protein
MVASETSPRFSHYLANSAARATPHVLTLVVALTLLFGWLQSDEEYVTPKSGLGYWLGIIGGGMMLLLLGYSYRKRRPMPRVLGSIPAWFRFHMFLGIFGPLLVVYHSNFRLGALNSNVALFAMLAVSLSGVAGRYIYSKIHMGLYGRKADAQEIHADIEEMRQEFDVDLDGMQATDNFFRELSEFRARAEQAEFSSASSSFYRGALAVLHSLYLRWRLPSHAHKLVLQKAYKEGWSSAERQARVEEVEIRLSTYISAVLKAIELRFFERLFALWHLFHLPLFVLLLVTAFVHVWAVHRY